MAAQCLSEAGGELLIAVRVTPRSPRQQVEGERAGRLIVRVNAPPADGSANASVRKLLAKTFGVPQSSVRIARGETGRDKTLALEGVDREYAEGKIAELSQS